MEKTFPKARLNLKRGKKLFQKHDESLSIIRISVPHYGAEILIIFGSYLWRNDDLLNLI